MTYIVFPESQVNWRRTWRNEKNSVHPRIRKLHPQSPKYLPHGYEFGIKWRDTIQLKYG